MDETSNEQGDVASEDSETLPKEIAFHYVKSSQFRVIHGDGFVGSVTPRGLIHFAIFSERPAIPQVVVHEVEPTGRVGKTKEQLGRGGIVRELEVDVMIDEAGARAFRDWLARRLEELETAKLEMAKRARDEASG